jgi:hypothetical protein
MCFSFLIFLENNQLITLTIADPAIPFMKVKILYDRMVWKESVTPKRGMVVVFPIQNFHETTVLEEGVKYCISNPKMLRVKLLQTGSPWFHNPFSLDLYYKRITLDEFRTKTEQIRPKPFEPRTYDVRIMKLNEKDSIDICTPEPIMLSNGNGPTQFIDNYRLHSSGKISYFIRQWPRLHELKHGEWANNIPTWSADFTVFVQPVVELVLLAGRFDKKCAFGLIHNTLVRRIAKILFETRCDNTWFFNLI